jgi:hypothetical protein
MVVNRGREFETTRSPVDRLLRGGFVLLVGAGRFAGCAKVAGHGDDLGVVHVREEKN